MQNLIHVTTRCYELATWSTHLRLTQRTIKTGISIYRPRLFCNAAFSPRNDSLLRTTLALQQLAHVTTRCYGLATTTRPYQRNVKTGTSIYQRPTSAFRNDSTDLSCPRRLSNCIQRLDRSQLTSCISTTRPTPATLVERPAANIYNATIPANDVTHPSWRLHTTATDIYIHVCNSGNKIVTFVVSIILPFCLPSLSLADTHTRTH